MTLVQRIQNLCDSKNTTLIGLERNIGIGRGTIRKWDEVSPSIDKLQKVADYFKVSTDFLLFGFEKTRLVNLIEAARCGRTIEQFSKDVDVDFEYLTKLCKGDISNPPSPETIKKIMDNSDSQLISDYHGLMEAAGHIDHQTAIELKLEEAKKTAAEMRQYFNNKNLTLAANRINGYDEPLTEDEILVLKTALEAYRKGKQNKKD